MPSKTAVKAPMPNSRRAKQFMSFDALHGLKDAITAAERVTEPRRHLAEEAIEQINNQLNKLKKGQIVTVLYYGEYEEQSMQLTGAVAKVDAYWKILQLGDVSISFAEIYQIIFEGQIS